MCVSYVLPVVVFIAYDTVLHRFFHFVDDDIAVGMGHDECLRTGALLSVLLYEGIVTGYLPLLVEEVAVGLVVLHALVVAIGVATLVVVAQYTSYPSGTLILQHLIVLRMTGVMLMLYSLMVPVCSAMLRSVEEMMMVPLSLSLSVMA